MNNLKYFIFFKILLFIILATITNVSKIRLSSKKRILSDDSTLIKEDKAQIIEEQAQYQNQINYEVYMEVKKVEEEAKKRRFEKSKELIRYNIKKWEFENNKKNIYKYKNDLLIIPCAYALDNAYVFPTLVAMTSLVENAGNKTFYSIYTLIDGNFTQENKEIIKSVEKKHPKHCEILFISMGNKFRDEKTDKRIKTPSYYRLELPALLPNVSRIIWMDGDTAVFEDLTPLIKLDMKGNYFMGFLDSLPDAIDKFGIVNATVLCAGVLLIDLDALRENNMMEKFKKFMIEKKDEINQHDQTVINVVCQGKIAPLPPKYGIWCFEHKKYGKKHNDRQRPHLRYDEKEFLDAYFHPAILHYVWPKPYWRRKKPVFNNEWWNYARISGYYNDVFTKSPKFVKWT